jgi:hypothetical protein
MQWRSAKKRVIPGLEARAIEEVNVSRGERGRTENYDRHVWIPGSRRKGAPRNDGNTYFGCSFRAAELMQ